MKDFDEARRIREQKDRSFVLSGQTFTYRAAVAPEAILAWSDAVTGNAELTEAEWLHMFDQTVLAILDADQEEKWRAARSIDAPHPLNLDDIRAVMRWLIGEATGRPTGEPQGSSDGSQTTEIQSRAESSPPAELSKASA